MNRQEHLLSILAEECNEVAQRAIKALRFGIAEIQENQDYANSERIRIEFSDLCAVYEMIGLNPPSRFLIEEKKNKVESFLKYSKECGTLKDS